MKNMFNRAKTSRYWQFRMKGNSTFLFMLMLYLLMVWGFSNCQSKKEDGKPAKIVVRWEAVTNFTEDPDKSEAQFVLINQGETLNDQNWALFFSKSPVLVESSEEGLLHIEHLNGDWFKISPRAGFNLTQGDSVQLNYRAIGHYIKYSDAPMGMYMVFYEKDGTVSRIAPINHLEIAPFSRREQLLRGMNDGLEAFSSGNLYRQNVNLSLIPQDQLLPIIPTPYYSKTGAKKYSVEKNLKLNFSKVLSFEANYLKGKLEELGLYTVEMNASDISLKPGAVGTPPSSTLQVITLSLDPTVLDEAKEGYSLSIDEQGIKIAGAAENGIFYGIQSLLALFYNEQDLANLEIPQLTILDQPRFAFRSMHLDVSRNFQNKTTVKRFLDILAHYKINNFLFYLAEDEAWRLEIPGLPELTQVGSKRVHPNPWGTPVVHPAYGSGPFPNTPNNHGTGFYTAEDFIEILKYAYERHINVVPAINFPGHSRATIMAMEQRYQKFMETGDVEKAEEYRLLDPTDQSVYLSAQHFKDNVINVSRESAYRFYEKVVDELAAMYKKAEVPFPIMHTGGDEVASGAWSASPEIQAWAKEKGIPGGYSQIQAAFFAELMPRLERRGLEIHGWEETAILHTNSEYKPNPAFVGRKVVPYIWNNLFDYPDMSYQLANLGYEVILCNVSNLYFDLAYDNDPREPGLTWGGFNNEKDAWAFAPYELYHSTFVNAMGVPLDLTDPKVGFTKLKTDARKNIRGLQAQMWGETIKGATMLEYYLLPKLIGFSETAWSKERSWESMPNRQQRITTLDAEWNVFANSIARREFIKLARWNGGYNFRVPTVGLYVDDQGLVHANASLPGVEIHYTTDGTEPDEKAILYRGPIPAQYQMKFRTFSNGRKGFVEQLP